MTQQLTWLATVLENAGLKVAEVPGWQNRGRPIPMGVVKGVICHHTGGSKNGNMPSLNLLINGRPELAGPLAQLGLGRDGTFYIIAAGRCNHAGSGIWEGETDGNGCFIGIEAENTGGSNNPPGAKDRPFDPWPAVQLDAYRRGVAAILKHIGVSAQMCCGHKEYRLPLGTKPDPHTIDMAQFRKEVQALMDGTALPPPLIKNKDLHDRPTLRRGSSANPKFLVEAVQKKLGFAGRQVDGKFGPSTEARVRQFQRDHGLVPDGIIGPKTWVEMDKR
ncbi:MAG: N-acetylmuramoyl-L-alanine amidase [Nitrosomonas sp.]|nr:MAG: N-acetylmuramoyl-L-alanine amidase [Nitrosomonas sp.]